MKEDNEKVLLKLRRRSQEVFEYEPGKLFLSIDGDLKASREIEGTRTDFSFELDEMPEFIEIYGEDDVRLAFLNLAGDSAASEQAGKFTFNFSEERKIRIALEEKASKIILDASYENPHFAQQRSLAAGFSEETPLAGFLRDLTAEETKIFGALLDSRKNENTLAEKLKNSFFNFKILLAGGSLAALLIVALLLAQSFVSSPNVSAAELIRQTASAEQTAAADTERISYRVLNFEETNEAGAVLKKRKIEIFNDAARQLSVRRLFDENNQLLAGEWRRQDGVSTLYAVGKTSELRLHRTDSDIIDHDLENLWQLSVSAKGFEAIAGSPENALVEEKDNEYRINYHSTNGRGVIKATLAVNRNLRADKLFLTVRQNDALREFSLTEAVFEQKNRESVEKAAFEPNSEFLKNAPPAGKNDVAVEKSGKSSDITGSTSTSPSENAALAATPELEVRVLQLLSNANALSGDQINITKTADGKIQIKGIVDAKKRRDEILGALTEVRDNPAVLVNIRTAEEAARNNPPGKIDGELESVSVESRNSIPAGDVLREHFSAQGLSEENIEAEIRRFASATLAKSSQVRRSALQLKQIAERFSVAELEKMDEATKNNWRRLIKQNAASLAQNSDGLRNNLRSALNVGGGNSNAGVNSADDAELIRAAKRIFELSLAIDRDVRASLSAGGNRGALPVKSAGFANNMAEITTLAEKLR